MGTSDVLRGLRSSRKSLPCRLLWDARGAELFARICTLDEYYLTRHELALLREHLGAIATAVGMNARVIEPGSGLALKTRLLLDALDRPAVYAPIELEPELLEATADELRRSYRDIEVVPICADYTGPFEIPRATRAYGRTLVFFPGSTIGNFELADAEVFLARFAQHAGRDGLLLLGADSNADRDALVHAYDDRDGVTAEFDRNILAHVNRVCDAEFDPAAFTHRAIWDADRTRIEMHLVSERVQRVRIGDETIEFDRGESIVTEHCYKYTPAVIEALLVRAGWRPATVFADPRGWMRLWLCVRA